MPPIDGAARDDAPRVRREDVSFASDGVPCAAWLYLPQASAPAPVVVLAHGLAGVREMRLDAYAERFCRAGYACLVFDYRHFGASAGTPRQLLDIRRQLDDWASAVRFVRERADVDGRRMVLWGTSLSGGHVLTVAARLGDVAAVIAQCPFTDGLASALAVDPMSSARVAALAVADAIAARRGRPPVMVPAVGVEGSTALMTSPDAMIGYLRFGPSSQARNEVAARFALEVVRYAPGRSTPQIACPVLFCVCERDSVAPARAALRHARRAPRGEVARYDLGHFDVYFGEPFERAVADQLAFLGRHVPVR